MVAKAIVPTLRPNTDNFDGALHAEARIDIAPATDD